MSHSKIAACLAAALHLPVSACLFVVTLVTASSAAAKPAAVDQFIDENCLACHSSEARMGGLDLSSLPLGGEHRDALATWIRVHDRVRDGEMPPKAMPRPDQEQAKLFLSSLKGEIVTIEREEREAVGRVHARRLTPVEYENTVHDLLGIRIPLQHLLPERSANVMFDRVATSQQISHFVLEKYLHAADVALDAAYRRALEPLQQFQRTFTIADLSSSTGRNNRQPMPHPSGEYAVAWSTGLVFVGRMPKTKVPEDGWYRIRLTASAVHPDNDGRVWATLRSGVSYAQAPSMFWIDALELTPEPREFEFEAWIRGNHMLQLQPGDYTFERPPYAPIRRDPYETTFARGLAGAAIHALEMERFFPGATPAEAQRMLFGEATVADGAVSSKSPREDARALLQAFATRAFRRPASDAEVAPYLALVREKLDQGASFQDALRAGYRGLLVSLNFLYLPEAPGQLDDYAVASRLSYLFWSAAPDQELLDLAGRGRLRDRATQRAQVERMLADPRAEAFTRNFTDQWLELRNIDFTQPDRDLFPQFDEVLKHSMLSETRTFFDELLTKDLSVSNFIDSDFMFLNTRLAKHYGLEVPPALGLQRVDAAARRGGVLTQGSVLKVTANGTNTSPVVRGVWVTERILGKPVPPPPPNVSAIEPDVRGANTIREQLAKHRNDATCSSCHAKIDPAGFALENYDPTGRWRERYPVVASQTEEGTVWKDGPAVDASYAMADGSEFEDVDGLKALVGRDREQIARNVVEKLLVYGTGAQTGFADRDEVDRIVASAADSDYGLRSLVHGVVASPSFLSK